MKYEQQIGYRYPKGRFAMVSVYAFTGAAILASTIFFSIAVFVYRRKPDDANLIWWFSDRF